MAVLTKQDRIEISKKIVGVEDEIATADSLAQQTEENKIKVQKKDDVNKKLLDDRTVLINNYQSEIKFFDGITRTQLTESIMEDSAKRLLNNSFFPNDQQTPLPSVPDGIWKAFFPLSKTHAIGKTNLEQYPATGARVEQNIISDINAKIALIEALAIPNKATGLKCELSGTCSLPIYTNETDCTDNSGTWTPGPDIYVTDTTVTTLLDDLKVLVQEWEDMLNNEKPFTIITDPNATRTSQNATASADIDNAIAVIDNWQSVQDYDTTTTLPSGINGSGCALFDAMIESDFEQTKLQPTTLQLLKNELTARSLFITTRLSQLSGSDYLGSITQDLTSGSITDTQGLYGERMLFIDMRLNVMAGTLSLKVNLEKGIEAQQKFIESSENAGKALSLVMSASKISAPALGNAYLVLKDSSQFSVNDRVYVVADNQEELSGAILEKTGNRVKLSFDIPKKYTTGNKTRIYKLL